MDASASALEADLELDRKELARVSKEAAEVENALAAAVREADAVLADKAINDKRIEVNHRKLFFGLTVSFQHWAHSVCKRSHIISVCSERMLTTNTMEKAVI